jgi:hypothetical protein
VVSRDAVDEFYLREEHAAAAGAATMSFLKTPLVNSIRTLHPRS